MSGERTVNSLPTKREDGAWLVLGCAWCQRWTRLATIVEGVFKSVELEAPGVISCLIKVYGRWRVWSVYRETVTAIARVAESLDARVVMPGPYEITVGRPRGP